VDLVQAVGVDSTLVRRQKHSPAHRKKAARERRIFRSFAGAAGYEVKLPSLRSGKRDSEPDITCRLASGERVAFELAEILDEGFGRKFGDTMKLKVELDRGLRGSSAPFQRSFNRQYSDALIGIDFRSDTSLRRRKLAIPAILNNLAGLGPRAEGEFFPKQRGIDEIIRVVRVFRGGFKGPVFAPVGAGAMGDPVRETIEGKLVKAYRTKLPLELVVYYDLQIQHPGREWRGEIGVLVAQGLVSSQFRRIWVFSLTSREILHVYLPP